MIPRYPTTSPTPALVDSGATLNFLHEDTVDTLRIDTQPCPPIEVMVVDGRPLPTKIQRQVTLDFTEHDETYQETFYVAPIGVHSMILGMPWLEHANPDIDWPTKTVKRRQRLEISTALRVNPGSSGDSSNDDDSRVNDDSSHEETQEEEETI